MKWMILTKMLSGASLGMIARLPFGKSELQIDSNRFLVVVFPSQLFRITYTLQQTPRISICIMPTTCSHRWIYAHMAWHVRHPSACSDRFLDSRPSMPNGRLQMKDLTLRPSSSERVSTVEGYKKFSWNISRSQNHRILKNEYGNVSTTQLSEKNYTKAVDRGIRVQRETPSNPCFWGSPASTSETVSNSKGKTCFDWCTADMSAMGMPPDKIWSQRWNVKNKQAIEIINCVTVRIRNCLNI